MDRKKIGKLLVVCAICLGAIVGLVFVLEKVF